MNFKNALTYRFTETPPILANPLLDRHDFLPTMPTQPTSIGFTQPANFMDEDTYIYNLPDIAATLITVKREDRILPTQTINDELARRIADSDAKLTTKERTLLKEQVIFELLPRAFTKSIRTNILISPPYIFVDTPSAKHAEDCLTLLRKALGSLPVVPLISALPNARPSTTMTDWLRTGDAPANLLIEDDCELKDAESAVIRCKKQDLTNPEIINHLESGKAVTKLGLNYRDELLFLLDESLQIKRLKYLDKFFDKPEYESIESEEEHFAADALLQWGLLQSLVTDLTVAFNGFDEENI